MRPADDGLSGSFWYEMDGAPAGYTCLPEAGVAIATAAGGGMASTTKDLYHSMFFWGYPRIYRMGFAVRAAKPSEIPEDIQKKIHQETDRMAAKIRKNHAPFKPTLKTRMWFSMIRWMHKAFWKFEPDYGYWEEHGWHGKNRPWKVKRKKRG